MYHSIWLTMRGVSIDVWSHRIKARKQIIGRAKECAIQIFDQKVSRMHAKIWERGGVVFIRDLDSRNGTYVEGVRITRCALISGKQLRIGEITFEVITSQSTVRTDMFSRLTSSTEHEVLSLGIPDGNKLHYVGRVGTGFKDWQLREVMEQLEPLVVADSPFADIPREDAAGARWVSAELVAEVTFGEWTGPGAWTPTTHHHFLALLQLELEPGPAASANDVAAVGLLRHDTFQAKLGSAGHEVLHIVVQHR